MNSTRELLKSNGPGKSAPLQSLGLYLVALMCLLPSQTTEAVDGKRVDAYVVTTQWRFGRINWSPACPDCNGNWAGNIELVTVRNGSVTSVDTIWKRSQGYGQYPAFDAEANRIAFYRWSKATIDNSSATLNNGVNTVSVMDRDGSNVRNLVTLRAAPYSEMGLNWPAGDWIYYINPQEGNNGVSTEVHKVNVNTLEDQLVYPFSSSSCSFRRFETTMDGSLVGIQTAGVTGDLNWNSVLTFPGMSHMEHYAGCNASISASGTYGSSYFAGSHTEIMLHRVGGQMKFCVPLYDKSVQYPTYDTDWPNPGNINDWLTNEPVFNGSTLNGSMSCECMRWAANSDKWVLQMVNHYGLGNEVVNGSNCVAANWIDKAAFLVSHNPKLPLDLPQVGVLFHGNSTGDMWVDGGPESLGKWEDTEGVWHSVPGYLPTSAIATHRKGMNHDAGVSITGTGSFVRVALPEGKIYDVRVVGAQGKVVATKRASGVAVVGGPALTPGVYTVIAKCGAESYRNTITVAPR